MTDLAVVNKNSLFLILVVWMLVMKVMTSNISMMSCYQDAGVASSFKSSWCVHAGESLFVFSPLCFLPRSSFCHTATYNGWRAGVRLATAGLIPAPDCPWTLVFFLEAPAAEALSHHRLIFVHAAHKHEVIRRSLIQMWLKAKRQSIWWRLLLTR